MKLRIMCTFFICLISFTTVYSQIYEGTFNKSNFKCPIDGTTEGYLNTTNGKRIEIASYVSINDGDYVQVSKYNWGKKTCEGKTYTIYFINEAAVSSTQEVKPHGISKKNIRYIKENDLQQFNSSVINRSKNNNLSTNTTISNTGSKVSKSEAEEALAFHNKVRADVGVSPLVWSEELSRFAQEWADHLASTSCLLIHRKNSQYGENIYGVTMGSDIYYTSLQASKAWYSEIKDFKNVVLNQSNWYGTGHYSQMVWKSTTEVGIGKARCPNGGFIIVANYNPPGNYMGQKAY